MDRLLLLDHHGLDVGEHAVADLDGHHAGADRADRLLEVHLALVDLEAAGLLDRVDDVLGGDRAEQAAVVARLMGDREHGLVEQLRAHLGALRRLGGGAVQGLLVALGGRDGALRGRLGQLARDQVVAEIALGDVDHGAALAHVLDVLEEDGLRHRGLPVAVAIAVPAALVAAVGPDVGQQGQLAGALDRRGDLVLVPAARARDAARADLATVGDELPQRGDVLVVDELDLVAAVLAGLPATAAGPALPVTPARRPAALLRHCWNPLLERKLVARRKAARRQDIASAAMPTREGSGNGSTPVRPAGEQPVGRRGDRGLERDVVVRGRAGARRGAGGLEVPVVDRDVRARGEAAAPVAGAVLAAAQELDGVGDDLDALALVAVLGLPLAPLEAAVERDGPALGEKARAVLALGAPDRDVEEVGLVLPLPRRLVLAARVGRDPQRAHGHAARGGAKLRISGQVAREDNAVDVRRGHEMAPFGGEGCLKLVGRPSLRAAPGESGLCPADWAVLLLSRRGVARDRACAATPRGRRRPARPAWRRR